jgi:hypothetical protein
MLHTVSTGKETWLDLIRPGQGQSSLVQANPTTPPLSGTEIGKETVKFPAICNYIYETTNAVTTKYGTGTTLTLVCPVGNSR